jgi:hypothetical protein
MMMGDDPRGTQYTLDTRYQFLIKFFLTILKIRLKCGSEIDFLSPFRLLDFTKFT